MKEFLKVVRTKYSAFKRLSKMSQEQASAAVAIALISEKNNRENKAKQKKGRVCVKPWLKRRKNLEFYETLFAELWLEDKQNYNILLRMTSENLKEIFQLIKDDITKENTEMREL